MRSRSFTPFDVGPLRELIAAAWAAHGPRVTFHVGDLHWRLRPRPDSDPCRDIRVWEDSQGLLGFAWYESDGSGDTQAAPRSGDAELHHAMLAWMEERARSEGRTQVIVGGFEGDATRHALLVQRGYQLGDSSYVHMMTDLGPSLPDPEVPPGLSLRTLAGSADYAKRDRIQALAFGRAHPNVQALRGLERDELYRSEHDFVVEDEAGEFLAFATVWPDERNRVGLFEPVGCHPDQRRRRLATAVMRGGLRALRRAGMKSAVVYPETSNEPAVRLYRSCGFEPVGVDCDYRKELAVA